MAGEANAILIVKLPGCQCRKLGLSKTGIVSKTGNVKNCGVENCDEAAAILHAYLYASRTHGEVVDSVTEGFALGRERTCLRVRICRYKPRAAV